MQDKVAEFRRVAEERRKQGRSARYTGAERRFALRHARQRIGTGTSVQGVARELGLGGQTLTYWLRTEAPTRRQPPPSKAQLIPVITCLEPIEERRSLIVVVAGDVRVELSDVAQAAELVRRLR